MRALIPQTMLLLLVAITAPGAPPKNTMSLAGRIVAYRPVDGIQVPSFAPNLEVFLFEVEGAGHGKTSAIVKIEYRHFGYSDITGQVLGKAPRMILRVKRNRSCDESYEHFVANAPSMHEEGSGKVAIGGVTFVEQFKDLKPPPDAVLKCYLLEAGGVEISNK